MALRHRNFCANSCRWQNRFCGLTHCYVDTPTSVLVLQEKILQQNFLEKCSEFTEQKNRLLKFIVVVSVLAFFLSIGITMYAVSQPDSIPGLVTMNDFGETQYIGPVSRKTIKTLMFQNLTNLLVRIARTNWSYKHIVI